MFRSNGESKFFCLIERRIRKLYDFILLSAGPENFVSPKQSPPRYFPANRRVQLALASRKTTQTWEARRARASRCLEHRDSGLSVWSTGQRSFGTSQTDCISNKSRILLTGGRRNYRGAKNLPLLGDRCARPPYRRLAANRSASPLVGSVYSRRRV